MNSIKVVEGLSYQKILKSKIVHHPQDAEGLNFVQPAETGSK
jgi:hypothetical protein